MGSVGVGGAAVVVGGWAPGFNATGGGRGTEVEAKAGGRLASERSGGAVEVVGVKGRNAVVLGIDNGVLSHWRL